MFNKKYTTSNGIPLDVIADFESNNNIKFPTDLVVLFNKFHEFDLAENLMGLILVEDIKLILNQNYGWESFKSVNFNRTEDALHYYEYRTNEYFSIASTMGNGALLIGNADYNSNRIFIEQPLEIEGIIEIACDFFDLINNVIDIKYEYLA